MKWFKGLPEEIDAFADDAMSHRLGNGASYYGKRKSAFYGESDIMRKKNKFVSNPEEDYQGPSGAGYFVWKKNEEGERVAVTRGKGTVIDPI